MPAGLPMSEEYIAKHLRRRQVGYGRGKRQQIETDFAEIISGVRHGLTMGGPIGLRIENRDWNNANWQVRMAVEPVEAEVERLTAMRPGHADLAGAVKYGLDDVRPVLERASARETTARVAAAAIARRLLEEFGIKIHSHVVAVGEVRANVPEPPDWERRRSIACALRRPGDGAEDHRPRSTIARRTTTPSAASSRCAPPACRSASAATCSGTASWTAGSPRP